MVIIHTFKDEIDYDNRFEFVTNKMINKIKFIEAEQRLYVNSEAYFENITSEIYNFQIGGYQICVKWLKDRKGKVLNNYEIEQFKYIVKALKNTIQIMSEIDKIIEEHGGWPLK